jgi:hypothetical protein
LDCPAQNAGYSAAKMLKAGAALVAIVCWSGLAIQFSVTYGIRHDVGSTLWTLARFFTILTNLGVAATMTWIAIGGRPSAIVLGGMTIALLLVGIVYSVLLQGLHQLSGGASVADLLLHKISPVLMTGWWLLFSPRSKLGTSAPIWWSLYPVLYFVYVLARGSYDGKYPYPFIDVSKLGWLQTALNAAGIAFTFLVGGFLLVWVDRWRPIGSGRSTR